MLAGPKGGSREGSEGQLIYRRKVDERTLAHSRCNPGYCSTQIHDERQLDARPRTTGPAPISLCRLGVAARRVACDYARESRCDDQRLRLFGPNQVQCFGASRVPSHARM